MDGGAPRAGTACEEPRDQLAITRTKIGNPTNQPLFIALPLSLLPQQPYQPLQLAYQILDGVEHLNLTEAQTAHSSVQLDR